MIQVDKTVQVDKTEQMDKAEQVHKTEQVDKTESNKAGDSSTRNAVKSQVRPRYPRTGGKNGTGGQSLTDG